MWFRHTLGVGHMGWGQNKDRGLSPEALGRGGLNMVKKREFEDLAWDPESACGRSLGRGENSQTV